MPLKNSSTATTAPYEPGASHEAALRGACEKVVQLGASGVQFRVAKNGHEFTVTSGVAKIGEDTPVPTDGRFRIACITKTFVAVVIVQLVSEGKVDLDAPVERYLPGLIPTGDRMTVRHLMQHTSGLFNHADSFQRPGERFMRDRYKQYEARELIAVAAERPLNFEPGTKFEYSNTNYIVIGELIKAVTGRSYADEIRDRILTPLDLKDTFLPGSDPTIPGPHAHGYMKIQGKTEDVTLMNPSEACSAGEMISTTADLDRFLLALIRHELLTEEQFAVLTEPLPEGLTLDLPMAEAYGLGIMRTATSTGLELWGHGGGIPGYATFIGATIDGETRVVASVTLDIDPDSFVGDFEAAVEDAITVAVTV
ncbi:D-alanyl-D-alanine carboxypeptidase [Saccharothrix ecbatanensis]|uniref:D-alanyl-D-alanine carboxypeptidase n=1 Tax=Saccharothrix ecbatanensis TaxID=1105145 RepID=A0A7W9HHC2_9PSEU|nr:serine hydrolase domain-containing protein [Saccharothrix ecbatanensis]MBB5802215.1 D-alanyl-D-alanine carboxypeptidase [Saccharothrix ecbatanensis]